MPSPNPQALNGLSLPSWINKHEKDQEEDEDVPPDGRIPDAVQVAVMIAMPGQMKNTRGEDDPLGEFQIGVTTVRCHS